MTKPCTPFPLRPSCSRRLRGNGRRTTSPALSRYRAEEDPAWKRWRGLAYKEIAAELASGREQLLARLKALSDADHERTGVHPKFGEMSLALWLEFFLVHEAHHLYVVMQLVRGN